MPGWSRIIDPSEQSTVPPVPINSPFLAHPGMFFGGINGESGQVFEKNPKFRRFRLFPEGGGKAHGKSEIPYEPRD